MIIVTNGDFGSKVGGYLQGGMDITLMSMEEALNRRWDCDTGQPVAFCADRPFFSLFRNLSKELGKSNITCSFAYVHHELTIGPLIVPGRSPCYNCFEGRMLSHLIAPWSLSLEKVVRTEFDRDWNLKVNGMLPTTPLLAASQLKKQFLFPDRNLGVVSQVSLSGTGWRNFKVLSVDGCDCGAGQKTDKSGSMDHLKPILANLLGS